MSNLDDLKEKLSRLNKEINGLNSEENIFDLVQIKKYFFLVEKQAAIYFQIAKFFEADQNYNEAIKNYLKSFELGYAEAASCLGFKRDYSDVDLSSSELIDLSNYTSNKNSEEIMIQAFRIFSGIEGSHNNAVAKRLFEEAGEMGCGISNYALSVIYYGIDKSKSTEYCQKAISKEYVPAQCEIAHLVDYKNNEIDLNRALNIFLKQIKNRSPFALKNIFSFKEAYFKYTRILNSFELDPSEKVIPSEVISDKLDSFETDMKEAISKIYFYAWIHNKIISNVPRGIVDYLESIDKLANEENYDYEKEISKKIIAVQKEIELALEKEKVYDFLITSMPVLQNKMITRGDIASTRNFFGILYECACENDQFNRKVTQRRQSTEVMMVNDAKNNLDLAETIHYLSIGSGGCAQDLINIVKLLAEGFRKFEIIQVEPEYSKNTHEFFKIILNSIEKELNADIKLTIVGNIIDVYNNIKKFDIINCIDFGEFLENLDTIVLSHQMLSSQGRLYLSVDYADYVFDKSNCTFFQTHKNLSGEFQSTVDKIFKDIKQRTKNIRDDNTLSYASLNSTYHWLEWTEVIPSLIDSGFNKLEVSLVRPDNEKEASQYNNFEYIAYLIKLFCKNKPEIIVTIHDSIVAFNSAPKPHNFHTISLLSYQNSKENIKQNIESISKFYPNSYLYYALIVRAHQNENASEVIEVCCQINKDNKFRLYSLRGQKEATKNILGEFFNDLYKYEDISSNNIDRFYSQADVKKLPHTDSQSLLRNIP